VTGPTRAEAFRRNRDVHMAHCGRKRQTYKFRRTRGMQRGIHDDALAGCCSFLHRYGAGLLSAVVVCIGGILVLPNLSMLASGALVRVQQLVPLERRSASCNRTVQDLRIKVYSQGSKCHYVIWP